MAQPQTQSSSAIAAQIVLALGCAAAVGAIAAVKCPESRHVHLPGFCLRTPWLPGANHRHPPVSNANVRVATTRIAETQASNHGPNLALLGENRSRQARSAGPTISLAAASLSLTRQRPWGTDAKAADRPPRFTPQRVSPFWTSDVQPPPGGGPAAPPIQPVGHVRAVVDAPRETEPSRRLEELFRRLEGLGATVLRLERQQAHPPRYRFRCEAPLPNSPRYSRFFQAFDAEPVQAVERVLAEVEAWRRAPRAAR